MTLNPIETLKTSIHCPNDTQNTKIHLFTNFSFVFVSKLHIFKKIKFTKTEVYADFYDINSILCWGPHSLTRLPFLYHFSRLGLHYIYSLDNLPKDLTNNFPKDFPKHFRSRSHNEEAMRRAGGAAPPIRSCSKCAPLSALRSHDGAMAAYVRYEWH